MTEIQNLPVELLENIAWRCSYTDLQNLSSTSRFNRNALKRVLDKREAEKYTESIIEKNLWLKSECYQCGYKYPPRKLQLNHKKSWIIEEFRNARAGIPCKRKDYERTEYRRLLKQRTNLSKADQVKYNLEDKIKQIDRDLIWKAATWEFLDPHDCPYKNYTW